MLCARCRKDFPAEELVAHGSQKVCEDCYMDLVSPLKACDPWAVHAAKNQVGTGEPPQLLPIQEKMLTWIREHGRVAPADLAAALGAEPAELEKNFAILRHMELLRGCKGEDGKVYWTLFERDDKRQ